MGIDFLTDHLVEEYESMPKRLRVAARFVLDHPKEVALMSMRQQARQAGVSHTTMVRLANWLGLGSYDDLRAFYFQALDGPVQPLKNTALRKTGSANGKEIHLVGQLAKTYAAQTASIADPDTATRLQSAAKLLAKSDRLFCMGQRSAYTIARHFTLVMSDFRENLILLDMTGGVGIDSIHRAGQGDALLAIGFAPYDRATIETAQNALRRSITVIAITDSRVSPLVRLARESIVVATNSQSFFQSMTPAVSAIEVLAALIAKRSTANVNEMSEKNISLKGIIVMSHSTRSKS
ncbi:MAG: MurR/RpiR family transcriptional regulator [Mesorhizobium sp.]|uniref:MurR/RpiR family transcriptional regulator n=1 Tax=Mesorhizobium sp. TaxID=1871066 RepID=UPI000FE64C1C|nr:MurR/RpiR family transcriptional regulator [Mesorhizobium sp.]RWI54749.1 MAG: MurR/RpiR family transcriptional regulator [Mesorhizobium sp.]